MAARKNAGAGKKTTKDAKKSRGLNKSRKDAGREAPVATSEKKRTPVHSETTPAGVMTEVTARAAVAAAPVRPSHDEIARRAYELWCAEGRPDGREHDHWLAAERSLIIEMKPAQSSMARR